MLRAPKLMFTVCSSEGKNLHSPGQVCHSATFQKSPAGKLLENSLPASDSCPKQHVSKCAEHVGCGAQSSLWPGRQGGGRTAPVALPRLAPAHLSADSHFRDRGESLKWVLVCL